MTGTRKDTKPRLATKHASNHEELKCRIRRFVSLPAGAFTIGGRCTVAAAAASLEIQTEAAKRQRESSGRQWGLHCVFAEPVAGATSSTSRRRQPAGRLACRYLRRMPIVQRWEWVEAGAAAVTTQESRSTRMIDRTRSGWSEDRHRLTGGRGRTSRRPRCRTSAQPRSPVGS